MAKMVLRFPMRRPAHARDQVMRMPDRAKVLHAGLNGGVPYLWALCDDRAPWIERAFVVVGDGQEVPDGLQHVASADPGGGIFNDGVHVFETFHSVVMD